MLESIGNLLSWGWVLAALGFVGLWGRGAYRAAQDRAMREQQARHAIELAGQRLENARHQAAEQAPPDTQRRNDFEGSP